MASFEASWLDGFETGWIDKNAVVAGQLIHQSFEQFISKSPGWSKLAGSTQTRVAGQLIFRSANLFVGHSNSSL